jgi:hypothetical protein
VCCGFYLIHCATPRSKDADVCLDDKKSVEVEAGSVLGRAAAGRGLGWGRLPTLLNSRTLALRNERVCKPLRVYSACAARGTGIVQDGF